MIKKFIQSQKQLTWRRIGLSIQITLLVVLMSIPQGTGGSNDGDPAPGRSPGPPHQSHKTSENVAKNSVVGVKTQSNDSIWCRSHFSPTNLPHVNVTLHHPLYEVFNNLLPGIVYQVSFHPISNKEPVEEVLISSTMKDFPVGSWKSESSRKFCPDVTWARLKVNEPAAWSFQLSQPANITFRVRYRLTSGKFYEENFSYSAVTDCLLRLRQTKGTFGSSDLPNVDSCRIIFPRKSSEESSSKHKEGLLIELTRLNVPCAGGGFIQFIEETNELEDGALNSPKKLCGKLEELNSVERKLYFPSLSETNRPFLLVHKNPVFSLSYHLVDYCYNVTFVSRNGSLVLNPVKNLLCHFRVHLPYGNRVLLRLQMGEDKLMSTTQTYDEKAQKLEGPGKLKLSSTSQTIRNTLNETSGKSQDDENMVWEEKESESECDGVLVIVGDGGLTWTHCSRHGDPKRDVQVSSQENVVTIKIVVRTTNAEHSGYPVVKFWYHAEPVSEIVSTCDFGEVLVKQFCVSSVKVHLDWDGAEEFCGKRGGHLASIRDENSQNVIDNLLLNSPDYREHNSYWIGASDKIYEGHFRWSDGFAFSYSNWFPGWPQQGFYNRQPNDDGFSHQDCVEIRRVFPHPSGSRIIDGITSSYLWNDLDCNTKNFFLCERLENGESSEQSWNQECNKTITLTREHPKAVVVSSGFPHQYPDNIHCETVVIAPPGFRLVIDFEELVLEKEPSCSYDYLELVEFSYNETYVARKLCGDMSDKLKLLRYISTRPKLKFIFVSDYSHHYGGFKARVSIESATRSELNAEMECSDERYQMFNNSCYLFVGYPKVTWDTANQICTGMKAELASVQNQEEESFITGNIRNSLEYTTSASYWLGGHLENSQQGGDWSWTDGTSMDYTAWPSNEAMEVSLKGEEKLCLAIQWVSSKTDKGHPTSGLYWTAQQCKRIGGYVCKKGNQVSGVMLNLNQTINGTEGYLTSPGYPSPYYHNLDYHIHLVGPVWTRMVIIFTKLDLETQADCLYDYIELRSGGSNEPEVRWCGNKSTKKNRFTFVSTNNEAILRFHSDYSVAGIGFYANWKAVDVTGCPSQKLTAREGIISSPNFGEFLLPRLECTAIILAPPGKRIWLEFTEVSLNEEGKRKDVTLELDLGGSVRPFQPFQTEEGLGDRNFISAGGKMAVKLKTFSDPRGSGFRAVYRTVNLAEEEKILELTPDSNGVLHHLNYPADPPPNVDFVQHLIAPVGYVIYLELQQVTLIESGKLCPDGSGLIEISDNYADVNGTWWFLCEVKSNIFYPTPPLAITSYLNSLHIRQKSSSIGARMNATLKVKQDEKFKLKLLQVPEGGAHVESCRPNPCQNGGKCVTTDGKKSCQCIGHFTGMFCALTLCELEPCLFGECELTAKGYRCHCQMGYTGPSCETKQSPCEDNPCEGRGECIEKSDTFHCRCHAWWEGPRCEKRMVHIPFKPLSERMLQEPFWLGLITVFVVLAIIGIVWCAKRHFPEKLEKLLAEEAERNSRSNVSGIIRPPSVREQMSAASGAVTVSNPPTTATNPRTLFGRLGTPSPRKKSSSSTPTKRNVAEKKQILQQLISPPATQSSSSKPDLNELIVMKESKKKSEAPAAKKPEWKETSFSTSGVKADSKTDLSKLEKKVTFARLLSKVSAEMSSGSEAETSTPALMRAVSTPVSPALDRKSSRGMSSNPGSDSISSSEIAISGSAFNSMLDIPTNVKRPTRLSYRGAKNASADSILEMFRSFASTSSLTKTIPTPSSTPTPSSPQEDRGISDESSAVETPISTTSGAMDSPTNRFAYSTTIEIPVMDPLTAQKSASSCSTNNLLQPPSILLEIPSGGINKCLSPIREVPTPMSSPALTPVMGRMNHKTVKVEAETSDEEVDKSDNDDGSEFSEVMIQVHREDEYLSPTEEDLVEENLTGDTNEENVLYINEGTVTEPPGMVIPLLTVQEPSPPSTSPPGSFPGSPPPYKADMDSFIYSPTNSARRLVKGFDKPNSLDLPFPPPTITITCNVSEPESDAESMSPAPKNPNLSSHNRTANSGGMSYLSPFSMCTRGDRTASESNLSSSGYSSMASPGPSRCGSNNPLCLSEVEDHQQSQSQPPSRRPSPLLRTPTKENNQSEEGKHLRGRSDSETLSDDPLMESNDEGIGTDHLDEKIEEGEVKSARELEIFMGKETTTSTTTTTTNSNNNNSNETVLDFSSIVIPSGQQRGTFKKCDNTDTVPTLGPTLTKASLQLPTIVVQSDYCDKLLSPVSSRSESPLSDKALGFGRFSPMFYSKSKCDQLLFTDSDGMYDFPSSDCPISNKHKSAQPGTNSHRKSTGRRRERRTSHRSLTSASKTSPVKGQNGLLDVPQQKELPSHRTIAQRKPSPKRRIRTQQPLSSSSSSTESLNSGKVSTLDSDTWRGKTETTTLPGSNEASAEDTAEETYKTTMDSQKDEQQPQKKIVGFRAIGHQIRFLRRIEQSLKQKEKTISSLDSDDNEDDVDDPSLSLLPRDLKKVGSIGILPAGTNTPKRRVNKKRNAAAMLIQRVPQSCQAQDTTLTVTRGQTN